MILLVVFEEMSHVAVTVLDAIDRLSGLEFVVQGRVRDVAK